MFVDLAGSHTNPDGISANPMFQFMGVDSLLNSNGEQASHSGYSIWAGVRTPVPMTKGEIGFEFNYGSKYWIAFTGGEDNLGGSKLAVRGKVYELYYHQPIVSSLWATLGGQYYDYDYTGSGSPVGQPKRIEDVNALDSLLPVADKLWKVYLQLNYSW